MFNHLVVCLVKDKHKYNNLEEINNQLKDKVYLVVPLKLVLFSEIKINHKDSEWETEVN